MKRFYTNLTPKQRFGFTIILVTFIVLYMVIGLINRLNAPKINNNEQLESQNISIDGANPNIFIKPISKKDDSLLSKPSVPEVTSDADGFYRTIEYYKNHNEEMINKIAECKNYPQPEVGYQNCLNANKASK